ncbi:MAG TPA: hypothetical protein DD723_09580 [Candidatus Omnitrophica bacterium]|nr:MAG: hypothetical protein A2Z81_02970 [Omnitrophica WOR_2 bacterium GWA2_45_18]OGX19022.1 MAG: hypothetical protein A2Y04_00700 [Omnitrophica WOR_2 bacterium GWC2_45_7]HBR15768.1 hypothetical protein [Candidatus Omnitrophota bacterium]
MSKFHGQYRIESVRLKDWDYSSQGAYFVTICTKDRECCLGEIVDGVEHSITARFFLKSALKN